MLPVLQLKLWVKIYYFNSTSYINQQLEKLKTWQNVSATVSHHQAKSGT
jgi:hypothetical protein